MKKIPTLFERVYENHRIIDIKPNITKGMEWVLVVLLEANNFTVCAVNAER